MNPADQLSKLFGFTDLPKNGCDTCKQQKKAFGVAVCGIGKPAPKDSSCAYWKMK